MTFLPVQTTAYSSKLREKIAVYVVVVAVSVAQVQSNAHHREHQGGGKKREPPSPLPPSPLLRVVAVCRGGRENPETRRRHTVINVTRNTKTERSSHLISSLFSSLSPPYAYT